LIHGGVVHRSVCTLTAVGHLRPTRVQSYLRTFVSNSGAQLMHESGHDLLLLPVHF